MYLEFEGKGKNSEVFDMNMKVLLKGYLNLLN